MCSDLAVIEGASGASWRFLRSLYMESNELLTDFFVAQKILWCVIEGGNRVYTKITDRVSYQLQVSS